MPVVAVVCLDLAPRCVARVAVPPLTSYTPRHSSLGLQLRARYPSPVSWSEVMITSHLAEV